jgi:FtsH-binding integral membrane protein
MSTASSVAALVVFALGMAELASVVWVYRDAQHRQERGRPVALSVGGRRRGSPLAWLLGCILAWIVFFPLYLWARRTTTDTGHPTGPSGPATQPGTSKQQTLLRVWAYRAAVGAAALAILTVTFGGSGLAGFFVGCALFFLIAPALALAGRFAPQLHSTWTTRRRPR